MQLILKRVELEFFMAKSSSIINLLSFMFCCCKKLAFFIKNKSRLKQFTVKEKLSMYAFKLTNTVFNNMRGDPHGNGD